MTRLPSAEERTLSLFTMKTDTEDPYARDGRPPEPYRAQMPPAKRQPKWFENREAQLFELRMNDRSPVLADIRTVTTGDDTYYLARTMKNADHPMSFGSMVDATTCVLEMLKE